jgi:hypothetical protein
MSARLFVLADDSVRERVARHAMDRQRAPDGWEVRFVPPSRSGPQNAFFHSMLSFIAKRIEWGGAKRDVDTWKRLLIAAWTRARGEPTEYLPALDGHGVDIVFRRSSELTRAEMAELIEYVYWWGATQELEFPARDALPAPRKELAR